MKTNLLRKKFKEWLKRYSIPLILTTLASILSANIIKIITDNNIIAGIGATWVGNFVFYAYIVFMDLKKRRLSGEKFGFVLFFKQMRNMFVEFAPAEYLDSFLIRPFYLSAFPYFISNYSLAILIGNLLAEITYFIPTIISYEFRKKVFKD